MANQEFVIGIEEKYPKELLKGRTNVEAMVVGCLWKDIILLDDVLLTKDNFITKDGRMLFQIADKLRRQGLNVLDEVSVITSLKPDILEKLEGLGGWDMIERMTEVIDTKNFPSYLEVLYRENTICNLYDFGFNIMKDVEFNGKMVNALKLFRKMDATQIMDFYESKLCSLGYSESSMVLEDCEIEIDDAFLEAIENGEENGIPFSECGIDINGDIMSAYPFLSSQINGFMPGALHMLGGFSSVGKTTFLTAIMLSMASQGHKVLVISNEQKVKVFKMSFLHLILYKHFRYYHLNKKRFLSGERTEEDREMIRKAQQYWKEHYSGMFKFIGIADSDMELVKKQIRRNVLEEGFSCVLYDTFKVSFSSNSNDSTHISLIKDSRALHEIAQRYNLIMLATIQLAINASNRVWLNADVLSYSKQIKEVLETLILMRNAFKAELDPSSKWYFHPFRLKKVDGKWIEEEYELNPNAVYRVVFVDKCRQGINSNDNGEAYLYEFLGNHGVFKEVCKVRPKQGTIY